MIDLTTKTALITAILTSILAVILPAINLLYQLNNPTLLKFPWPSSTCISSRKQKKDKQTTVVFAGSFNPPHNGHLVMIQYLAMRYKEVIVVIGMNPDKEYKVSPQKRADILSKMVDTLELGRECNVRVEGEFLFVVHYLLSYQSHANTNLLTQIEYTYSYAQYIICIIQIYFHTYICCHKSQWFRDSSGDMPWQIMQKYSFAVYEHGKKMAMRREHFIN